MYDILTLQQWIRALYDANIGQGAGLSLWIEPYAYPITITGLVGVGGSASATLAINSNADFVLTRINAHANVSAAQNVGNKTVPFVRVQVTDAGSARPFFNAPVDMENFTANDFPGRFLPYPRWISANSSLLIQATGYATAAETYGQIELSFEGVSVRRLSQPMSGSGAQG